MQCCIAAKHAPIAADSTVRVGARRGQRQHARSPQASSITATIKTLIYPYFSDLNRFPLRRALRLLGGGKEIGNRLFWGTSFSFCFSIGYRRAGVLFFSTTTHLLSSFCGSASTYSYSTDGPSSHSSRLGKWHSLDQHLISTPLFSNIRYLGRAPVGHLTSILLYLVACLLFLGRGESALFTVS